MTEREKMLAGERYDPLDPGLVTARRRARDLCQAPNATREEQQSERRSNLRGLFGAVGDTVWMQPPFFCDYGCNIELGERVFFNFNCVVLDVCRVRIGSFTRSVRRCRSTPPRIHWEPHCAGNASRASRSISARTSGWAAAQSSCPAYASVLAP
jgi:acetyltransferase-like isoleucine patch superfamily enzyme